MHVNSDADARFDRTVERWFREMLEMDPEGATYLGVHDHDHELADGTREHVERQAAFHRAAITEMERLPADDISSDRALDRDLVIHEAKLAVHQLTERRQWAGSTNAAEHIGNALFPIFTRDYAPLDERLESITSRLEGAPAYMAQSRTRVDAPVRLWVEIDIESSQSLPEFIDTIVAVARSERTDSALLARLEAAAEGTQAALDEHVTWLRDDALPRAKASWQTGREGLEQLITLRRLEADGDEILAVGERMLAEETAARDAICIEIDPTLSPAEVGDLVREDHPRTFPEALEAYRDSMAQARAFVVDHDLATLPDQDRLKVIETPSFERHVIPFAAYYQPARFDPNPAGTYVVTPPATHEMWREHNYAAISNTGVHEAYPGHHLQLSAATTNPSLVRALSLSAAEFDEGWAFYCERMMKEAGFDDTPIHRYVLHTDAIWRSVRIILDIRLHRGDIGFEEAVDFMAERTGFERHAALAEVKRYTSTPTYQLSYLYGRHMIEALRDRVQRRMGPAFNLKFFHDTLIYGGTMPVSFAARLFDAKLGGLDR
ncbi:MAG TPA: DUF885 domain-containing protein [Candidatus Limnocylindria bacterium]|nr:DUF885 domain-containing protein [Candidatus Limnocylindria bacterium]